MKKTIKNQIDKARKNEPTYYETIGHAIQHIDNCLKIGGYQLGDCMAVAEGKNLIAIQDQDGQEIRTSIVFCSLYRMPSGRYELTWYIS